MLDTRSKPGETVTASAPVMTVSSDSISVSEISPPAGTSDKTVRLITENDHTTGEAQQQALPAHEVAEISPRTLQPRPPSPQPADFTTAAVDAWNLRAGGFLQQ